LPHQKIMPNNSCKKACNKTLLRLALHSKIRPFYRQKQIWTNG
jgi:hypothetical protein